MLPGTGECHIYMSPILGHKFCRTIYVLYRTINVLRRTIIVLLRTDIVLPNLCPEIGLIYSVQNDSCSAQNDFVLCRIFFVLRRTTFVLRRTIIVLRRTIFSLLLIASLVDGRLPTRKAHRA